jgi:hypothetical protein
MAGLTILVSSGPPKIKMAKDHDGFPSQLFAIDGFSGLPRIAGASIACWRSEKQKKLQTPVHRTDYVFMVP